MAIELPDVEQEWTANVAPYIAAMAEMVASVKAAKDESLAAIAEIQAALDALHGGDVNSGSTRLGLRPRGCGDGRGSPRRRPD